MELYTEKNPVKLFMELKNAGVKIEKFTNDLGAGEYIAENTWIEFAEGTNIEFVQKIIDAHDPTPLSQPLTETEQLRLETARSNTELFETMIMMNGGV